MTKVEKSLKQEREILFSEDGKGFMVFVVFLNCEFISLRVIRLFNKDYRASIRAKPCSKFFLVGTHLYF